MNGKYSIVIRNGISRVSVKYWIGERYCEYEIGIG